MSYKIKNYTYQKAKDLGVTVKPSKTKGKKIDVFNKDGDRIAVIGALGYGDYPTFIKEYGKSYADNRRKQYKIRHEKDRHVRGSNGWYADKLLW
jgi:hypothetical protein